MKIDKVMNNNVVSSIDEDGQEIIVVGTGIGFQGKEGKVVDEKKIQKIFRLEDPKTSFCPICTKASPIDASP